MRYLSNRGQELLMKSISVATMIVNEYGVDRDELAIKLDKMMNQILHNEGGDGAYDKLDMALDSLVDEYRVQSSNGN